MKNILKIGLLLLAVVLAFLIYKTIQNEVQFDKDRVDRYVTAIGQLQDVANAEKLYMGANGEYTDNLDSLKEYINNGKIMIVTRRDTSYYVYNSARRIDEMKSFTIFDTIVSPASVKDSIFGGRNALDNFGYVPVDGKRVPIKLYASFSDRIVGEDSTNIQRDNFFMATVNKKDVLGGLDEDQVARELFDETSPIKGEVLQVGSDLRPSLEGNWGTDLDQELKKQRSTAAK